MEIHSRIIVTNKAKRERFYRLIRDAREKLDALGISYGVIGEEKYNGTIRCKCESEAFEKIKEF